MARIQPVLVLTLVLALLSAPAALAAPSGDQGSDVRFDTSLVQLGEQILATLGLQATFEKIGRVLDPNGQPGAENENGDDVGSLPQAPTSQDQPLPGSPSTPDA